MSNLYNQNIGQNYRGILNLDATTINTPLDATLRAVTDGMGTSSLLNLSTEQVSVLRTVNLAAGATNPSLFNVVYTINNSGAQTGTLRGIFLNATETALNGMSHNLMDLQVGGVSRVRIDNAGSIFTNAYLVSFNRVQFNGGASSNFGYIMGQSNGVLRLTNSSESDFNRLQLGGTTNLFPAIKRNGAAIDFRLADDSNFAAISANTISSLTTGGVSVLSINNSGNFITTTSNFSSVLTNDSNSLQVTGSVAAIRVGTSISIAASAILQSDSTTRGFLPPRMTNAQRVAITSPAIGLIVYCTDVVEGLYINKSTGWTFVI
jgi:hypothetical protein